MFGGDMKRTLLMICITFFTYGCAGLLSLDRTFIEEMDHEDERIFTPGRDFQVVPGDSGNPNRTPDEISLRTPASKYEQKQVKEKRSLVNELKEREDKLHNEELYRYLDASKYLSSTSEKLYYLDLPPRERKFYIMAKNGSGIAVEEQEKVPTAVSIMKYSLTNENEISLGMDKNSVRSRWGGPARIDVAGDPRFQNERWTFYDSGRIKQVFFENGLVQGWSQ